MTEPAELDAAALRGWIGRTETARDVVAKRLAEELRATLNADATSSEPPLAIHWCLAPPAAPTASLGPDGHPARGGFLPPVPLPRRMWAGSALTFHDRLRIGDAVERRSRIADVTIKQGRTGRLCFVTVEHEFTTDRGLAITERQEIVYRGLQSAQPVPSRAEVPEAGWTRDLTADPVLLFRYSALTFNGHRIHYDRSYVTEVEGYPGLIVHGPLQATLLVDFAASIKGAAPWTFQFRGMQPLFDFERFRLCAREREAGLHLWIEAEDGRQTMDAQASW
jgi:3-methylfumaryl-CoA hydratase